MNRQRFSSGARFRWQETTYQILRLLPGGQANIESILTGVTSVVEISSLVHALFADELHFVSENVPVLPNAQTNRGVDEAPLCLSDYPAALVDVARYRLDVIRPLLELKRRTRAAVLTRVQEIKNTQAEYGEHTLLDSLSIAAIYRWIGDYVRSGQDLRALLPAVHERGGKQETRLRSETEALWKWSSRTSTKSTRRSP